MRLPTGNGRRASGSRRKRSSPLCSKSASCSHDGKPPHTQKFRQSLTHPPRSTQLCRQFLLQHAAGLNEEAAIDCFVRYLNVLVGWELLLQPAPRSAAATIAAQASAPRTIVQRQTTRLGAQRPLPSTPISTVCTIGLTAAVASD